MSQMNYSGLVSVSFRTNTADEIIAACSAAGLAFIEWGSDVHVPAGDLYLAKEIAQKCKNVGISCPSYGSYYRIGCSEIHSFEQYLLTAEALWANVIRVWAGTKASSEISANDYKGMVLEAKNISNMAAARGMSVSLECHNQTLTDQYTAALHYLEDVDQSNFGMYWQPNQLYSFDYNKRAAKALAPYVYHVHVFHWKNQKKYSLWEGMEEWKEYRNLLGKKRHIYLLEFMPDHRLESLSAEAKALFDLLQ